MEKIHIWAIGIVTEIGISTDLHAYGLAYEV